MVRKLTPLKTLLEINTTEDTVEALVVEIPIKLASRVLNILKPIFPPTTSPSTLPHLRRLVTHDRLPIHLRSSSNDAVHNVQTIFLLLLPPLPESPDAVVGSLKPHIQDADHLPVIRSTHVPLHPPMSAEQAATWSLENWPSTYNPASQTIQNAPPLHSLRRVQAELDTECLNDYLQLAQYVAEECKVLSIGRKVGAVVVDPLRHEVVAVAGDARFWTPGLHQQGGEYWGTCDGRPEHHALMRVIAMVAQKELEWRMTEKDAESHGAGPNINLAGHPLTDTEAFYFTPSATENMRRFSDEHARLLPKKQSSSRPETYLCSGLDVYLTHEPCVCCAMAMIHSRFRACVFSQRMPGTGGLCAEKDDGGLGYGLFWRRELNWRVLTFQFSGDWTAEDDDKDDQSERERTEVFHA